MVGVRDAWNDHIDWSRSTGGERLLIEAERLGNRETAFTVGYAIIATTAYESMPIKTFVVIVDNRIQAKSTSSLPTKSLGRTNVNAYDAESLRNQC